jgi:hypothetical protein
MGLWVTARTGSEVTVALQAGCCGGGRVTARSSLNAVATAADATARAALRTLNLPGR